MIVLMCTGTTQNYQVVFDVYMTARSLPATAQRQCTVEPILFMDDGLDRRQIDRVTSLHCSFDRVHDGTFHFRVILREYTAGTAYWLSVRWRLTNGDKPVGSGRNLDSPFHIPD
jgi:hypothetical protein